ncbi:SDR family NAD(P)-dependent oxidoreductase [Lentzea sp. NPDC059081]|uniref:SDR family NAD(P)-dependent oxidoreductase n=1 Tax=Lentzea sp. NPDC059081 TaxID=3346719 RepID=UPI0036964520
MSLQHPIGSPFTAASTADDVLAGIDLTGQNVIITGGHTGLGREMTRALSGAGASVTVGARDVDRATAALTGIEGVAVDRLDLADPASVTAFAARRVASGQPVHVLINNAGVMGGPLVHDARGFESHLATNHLGHFQLTRDLLPALLAAGGARVVTMTSGAHRMTDIRWDDPQFAAGGYDELGWAGYGQSKTANVLFTVELDRRYAEQGIRAYAVHPGIVLGTGLGPQRAAGEPLVLHDGALAQFQAMGLVDADGTAIIDPETDKKTPAQGASTAVFAATSPLLDDIGGVYLRNNEVSALEEPVFDPMASSLVARHAVDPGSARRLWELSETMLKG